MTKKDIGSSLNEFLDNVTLIRMEDDLSVLAKRLGFAEKKKDDLQQNHPKRWWEVAAVIKDERHGINPLSSRLEAKKKEYEELEKRMKKNKEEILVDDQEKLSLSAHKLSRGDYKLLKVLLVLTYIKYVQEVYGDDLAIEKKGETFDNFTTLILGDSKPGENYFSILKLAYGKISSLPKVNRDSMIKALRVVLGLLVKKTPAEDLKEYITSFKGLETANEEFPSSLEEIATTLALISALIKSLEKDTFGGVIREALISSYLEIRERNGKDCLLIEKDLDINKKILKMFHRFEEFLLEGK